MNIHQHDDSFIPQSASLRSEIQSLIPRFQKFCLQSNYDVVIPIESEGFSILWPELGSARNERPRIIPSSVVARAQPSDINGKRVLIVDVSTYSGNTIRTLRKGVQEKFNSASVDLASMIVYKELQNELNFVNADQMVLSQNSYDWARQSIMEYISGNVFMHFGDPPLWGFHYLPAQRSALFDALENAGTFYALPQYAEDPSEWLRYSLDNVQLSDKNWLPKSIEPEKFVKLRLFIHKTEPRILVLPLFFPIIPKKLDFTLSDILEAATDYFPSNFREIIDISKQLDKDPYIYMRWLSTIGTMLLLRDFHRKIFRNGMQLNPDKKFLKGPVPNLRNYSCSSDVLSAIESVMKSMLSIEGPYSSNNEFPDIFTFRISDALQWYKKPVPPELTFTTAEEYLGAVIGHSSRLDNIGNKKHTKANNPFAELISCEFTFPELSEKAHFLSQFGLNRALDVLIDEGILNLCFKEDSDERIHRGYYVGGESKRRILETLGYAFEDFIIAPS